MEQKKKTCDGTCLQYCLTEATFALIIKPGVYSIKSCVRKFAALWARTVCVRYKQGDVMWNLKVTLVFYISSASLGIAYKLFNTLYL